MATAKTTQKTVNKAVNGIDPQPIKPKKKRFVKNPLRNFGIFKHLNITTEEFRYGKK